MPPGESGWYRHRAARSSARVAVARLADRADVAQGLSAIEFVGVIDFFGRVEDVEVIGGLLDEDAWNVGVPLEAVALDEGEDALHLALVVDVFGEDVLVERIAGAAVNVEEAILAEAARPLGQELPALLPRLPAFG